MKRFIAASTVLSALGLSITLALPASANENVYGPYPVTYKGAWFGKEKNTVSYKGQIARHLLHDSLKSLSGKGNGKANPELRKKMLSYFSEKGEGRKILAPKTNKGFKRLSSENTIFQKFRPIILFRYKITCPYLPLRISSYTTFFNFT